MVFTNVPQFSAALFTWENLKGTAFVSDLNTGVLYLEFFYSGKCYEGFELVSPRTGEIRKFFLSGIDYSNECVQVWNFKELQTEIDGETEHPMRLIVFND